MPETVLFRDPDRARRDLDQLRLRLPDELVSATLALLHECADPDQGLNLFERLTAVCDPELINVLDTNRVLLHYVLALFGQSYWLGEFMVRCPDVVYSLSREEHLERSFAHEEFRRNLELYRSHCCNPDPAAFLAGFKKQEYVRITLRDVLNIATLAETTAELSALADVLIEAALDAAESQMRAYLGEAQINIGKAGFAVLALGKLGGNELNYSSDLDLLYLFDDRGSAAAMREYFTRLGQILTDILSRPTAEGSVFRVDLRLRPHGGQGELAAGVHQSLEYYSRVAHDWELQALIKTRHVAGNPSLSREFIAGVQARVYNPELNFAAIDTALRSRERIVSRGKLRGLASVHNGSVDVKLDRGGIRDIEFLVQCLQRVYGGEEKWLRSSGTLFSLQKLHDKGHLSGQDFHRLTQAYQFLRRLEHRLQLQRGQQLHRVPSDSESLAVLQRAMSSGPVQSNADLVESIERHRTAVTAIYDRIVLKEKRRAKLGGGVLLPSAKTPREMSFEQLLERIGEDSSAIHEIANRPFPVSTRRNLHRFLASTMTTTERYAELLTNPEAVERAIQLFGVSDYLTDILVRHPDTIRALDRMISEEVALPPVPLPVGGVHSASSLDSLRQHFRQASFSIAASDVLAPGPAFQSMRKNSRLADSAICQALNLAGGADKLAVFALGRLGTQEFDIASDADLLFVRDPSSDPEAARMAAEKLVHALSAYTREGALFAVDARLRPHGKEGELVITPAQLERYLADEAQPWEALTYSKLHFVAGCDHLAASLLPKVRHSVAEMAVRAGFVQSVLEMRTRLEKSNRYPGSFKLARGGFYDIDFIASFLMLRYGSLHSGNTLERLEHLHRCGALDAGTFQDLRDSTLLYRTTDHVIRLVTGRARPELPAAEHAREAVQELTDEILRRSKLQTLQTELSATSVRVRHAFAHFLHP